MKFRVSFAYKTADGVETSYIKETDIYEEFSRSVPVGFTSGYESANYRFHATPIDADDLQMIIDMIQDDLGLGDNLLSINIHTF